MKLTWANLLSGLRVLLIPLFALAVARDEMAWALALFALAGITDLLDGLVARWYHQQSKLGAYLDPAADKLLLTTAYLLLSLPLDGWPRLIPFWVFLLVIIRDLVIVTGALVIYLRIGYSRFVPLPLSKWNTALQIIAIFLVLIAEVIPDWAPFTTPYASWLARLSVLGVVLSTIASGLEYAYRFIYRYSDLKTEVEG